MQEYLCPFLGKSVLTTIQKYLLCFLEDATYERWMEVFDAWEQGKLIMEDGKKPNGCIPKIPNRDITVNDVDRTVGLRDSEMMMLADAILAKEVSIKNNKLSSEQQREGISLPEWCRLRKRMRLIMNKLMAEFRNKELPSKNKEYVEYTDMEWEDLARSKNLTDETLRNIVNEVEVDKGDMEWLDRRANQLSSSQRDTDPAPTVYVQAVQKFAMVKVRGADFQEGVDFSVEVAATLKDALPCLPAVDRVSKPEVVVIFSYDAHGESLYIWLGDVSTINAQILREEENQDKDTYDPPRRVLLAPTVFVCDSARTVNVQAFAANSQSRVWSAHKTLYLPSAERNFRKSVMDPRPVVHLTICYPSAVDQRQREEFQTFSEFSGIKKELEPVWDEALKPPSEDWAGGKCSVSLPLLKQTLLPTIKKYDCRVINI